ncbi:MAG: nuclear transport factor 2 family protein [Candidatus Marinimicrobia bacterium]|nr:nuclear transport factor 2 family protein [Candidatus Neomarinimicrobiota bacterium]MCF7827727.1 nuclear transport factor 2 family protein [Candidatus Neomarinimicrobiota bacterium]MCF7881218.1 nuclear transport factor 2 family protein [Candidatus Neomarinimicrobiota bacterium]
MRHYIKVFCLVILIGQPDLTAQIPPTPAEDQQALLESDDPELEKNKKLVYDCWRIVLEARHLDQAEKYMKEDYIQHNPNVATGREAFVEFFSQFGEPQPIKDTIQMPLIEIVAEGDMVVLSFAREYPDPNDESKTYTTTWFDMFRIENGKLAEHWDSARKR